MATARGEQETHLGRPAATKLHGLRRPQPRQVAIGNRKQLLQISGPLLVARWATGKTRSQRPQGRAGRGAHAKHKAPPPLPLAVTTLSRPHDEHGSASWWARHRPHSPIRSTRINGRPVRRQRAQTGTGRVEPRARSSPTKRATTAGAPPARTSGPNFNALARSRAAAGVVMVASMAAATWPTDSSGQAAVAAVAIASTRQAPQTVDGPAPAAS